MMRVCRFCKQEFEPAINNQLSCSKRCADLYRYRDPSRSKPAMVYRGANYRNFLNSLRTKLNQRRDIDIQYLCKLYEDQCGKCALSGRQLTFITGKGIVDTNISIDRIDSSLGYVEGNLQLVCRQANIMKQRLSEQELSSWCADICTTYKRKRK